MKILYLGANESPLIDYLRSIDEEVITTIEPLNLKILEEVSPDFIISYGYQHIIKKQVLEKYPNRVINLHVSYLPWNRGADPNFWSIVENTPKGVTIHYIDMGIDTGDIIAQKKVIFSNDDTLRTSYDELQVEIQNLFKENWMRIRNGKCGRLKQEGKGTFHKDKDFESKKHLLINGWDTPISVLEQYTDRNNHN